MSRPVRAKYLAESCVEAPDDNRGNYVGLEHVSGSTAQLVDQWDGNGDVDSGIAYESNDVLFGKLRPYLSKSWLTDRAGVCSGEFLVLRVGRELNDRYLKYLTLGRPWLEHAATTSYGSKMPRTTWEAMGELKVQLPTWFTQRAVVDFLDRETAKIDALIAKHQDLRAAAQEHRVALIISATGRESLAKSGFVVDKLGRRTTIGNGSTPSREEMDFWDRGMIPWLNSSVVNQARVTQPSSLVTEEALERCHLPWVQAGSLLVGLTGQGKTRGKATITGIGATINQHIAFVRPSRSFWVAEFLLFQLQAAYDELRMISDENGSTKGGLTCRDLSNVRVAMPSLREQAARAIRLTSELKKVDSILVAESQLEEVLRERRSALITAAVTGQIDVATYGQAEPSASSLT